MADKEIKNRFDVTRRFLCKFLIISFFFGLAGWFMYPALKFLMPPRKSQIDPDILSIPVSQLPLEQYLITKYQDRPVIVINNQGSIHALTAVCTHLGCLVKWDPNNKEIFCPCHMSTYDLYGNVKTGPAPKPLLAFNVRVTYDQIIIESV